MKSEKLGLDDVKEVVDSLRQGVGFIEGSIDLLEGKVSDSDLNDYKRMVGKIIIAVYSGLADKVMEKYPDFANTFYEEGEKNSQRGDTH
jgi:hypothetical protein